MSVHGSNADDEPYVTDVERGAAPAGGLYQTGDTITASVTFSETVDATGTPRLPLDIGGTTRYATAAPVTGATVVDFTYTVQAADYDADGFEISENTLELNGGTINRAGTTTVDADLDHPGVGAHSDHSVNAAVIAEVAMVSEAPPGNVYIMGDDIEIGVTFSRSVKVTGTPQLAFCLNSSGQTCKEKQADYDRVSGSNTVVFRYTVQADDEDNNGIWIDEDAVSLNGGAITLEDGSSRAANLGHGVQGTQNDHQVDGSRSIVQVAVSSTPELETDTYGAGETIRFTVTFSAAVDVAGDPIFRFALGNATPRAVDAAYEPGSGTTALVFGYTVVSSDGDDNGIFLYDGTDLNNPDGPVRLDSDDSIKFTGTSTDVPLAWPSGRGTQSGHKVDGSRTSSALMDATLSELSVSVPDLFGVALVAVDLSPAFDPEIEMYSLLVAFDKSRVTFMPATNQAGATVAYFDGDDMALADAGTGPSAINEGHQVNTAVGPNTVKVKVTAPDGTTPKTYTVTVTRELPTLFGSGAQEDGTIVGLQFQSDFPSGTGTLSAAAVAAFTVTADGVERPITGIAVGYQDNILDVTLSTPIYQGQAIVVSYDSAAALVDQYGDKFQSFTTGEDGVPAAENNSTATFPAPSTPTGFMATAGDKRVRLSWDAPASNSGVTRHEYRYKTDGGYPAAWTQIANSAVGEANATAFTVTPLINGTAYTFELRAVSPTSPTQRELCRFSLFSTTQVIELLESCTPNSPQYRL